MGFIYLVPESDEMPPIERPDKHASEDVLYPLGARQHVDRSCMTPSKIICICVLLTEILPFYY
jgi:hypothetical protein